MLASNSLIAKLTLLYKNEQKHTNSKKIRTWQDSNLQSSDSKSDALSITLQVLHTTLSIFSSIYFHPTVHSHDGFLKLLKRIFCALQDLA